MYLTNSPDFVFTLLGIWGIGCGAPFINYNLAGDALVHCLSVSKSKLLIVDGDADCRARIDEVRPRIEQELGMKIITLDTPTKQIIKQTIDSRPPDSLRKALRMDFPGFLLYTSGSTGLPKAVAFPMLRGQYLGERWLAAISLRGGPHGSRLYDCMPLYHGTGGVSAISCLLGGATLCVGKKFSTSNFWREVRESGAEAFIYVGETARYLLAAPPSPLDKQHKVKVMYGNGMRPDVWARFQERFGIDGVCEFFNSSEGQLSLLNVCRGPFLRNAVGHHGALFRRRMKDLYVPVEIDHETGDLVRDATTGLGRRQPYEEGGEILVRLENEAGWSGYFGNPDATSKKFVRNVLRKGDLYYRSGDALRRDVDGRWYFMDRLGDTYRWKSENVSTAEVAAVLGRFPGIDEAIVYGVQVPGYDGRAGCAALVLSSSATVSPQFFSELVAFCKDNMPRYAVPVFLRILMQQRSMHNNKQEKAPLKKDEIDLDAIYGSGADVDEARRAGKDTVLYWPGGLAKSAKATNDGETYIYFTRADAEALKAGGPQPSARL